VTDRMERSCIHHRTFTPFVTNKRSRSSLFSVLSQDYLRLTSPPSPSSVRTVSTLSKWHSHLVALIKSSTYLYPYLCSQYKSIRQDLTVQRINTAFTVRVYETHARVALEHGDLNEFNQCQTQLKELYGIFNPHPEKREGGRTRGEINKGRDVKHPSECSLARRNVAEFVAYNVLYAVMVHSSGKGEGSTEVMKCMESISRNSEIRDSPDVRHALEVRAALAEGNFVVFFKLYMGAPKMSAYIMDFIIPSLRFRVVTVMCRAYKPTLGSGWLSGMCGFYIEGGNEFEGTSGEEERRRGVEYLRSCGCLIEVRGGRGVVDTKNSILAMPSETKRKE